MLKPCLSQLIVWCNYSSVEKMKEQKPLISVIVPVYKVEKYLHKCVDSILTQTLSDIELILVDDGSPDWSGAICDEYVEKDSRVRTIHKPNGGVSSARNKGLDVCTGEWIMFVDSDDFIDQNTLEEAIKKTENTDLVVFGIMDDYPDENRTVSKKYNDVSFYSQAQKFVYADRNGMLKGPVNKLFKHRLLSDNNVRFDLSISYGEDTKFTFQYLLYCDNINYIWENFYHYCHYMSDSLSSYKYKYEEWMKTAEMLYNIRIPVYKNNKVPESLYNQIYYNYFYHSVCAIISLYNDSRYKKYTDRLNVLNSFTKDSISKRYKPITTLHKILKTLSFNTMLLDMFMKFYLLNQKK